MLLQRWTLFFAIICVTTDSTASTDSDASSSNDADVGTTTTTTISTTTKPTDTTAAWKWIESQSLSKSQWSYKRWVEEYLQFPQSMKEVSNGTVIPQYWRSRKFLQNLTAIQYLYYHKYAFCTHFYRHYAPTSCTSFYEWNTTGIYSPLFRTVSEGGYTNAYETNPLRCHLMDAILDQWAQKPHFVYHFRKMKESTWITQYNATAALLNRPAEEIHVMEPDDDSDLFTCKKATDISIPALPFQAWASNQQNDYHAFDYDYEEDEASHSSFDSYEIEDDRKTTHTNDSAIDDDTTTTIKTTTMGIDLLPYDESQEVLNKWYSRPRHLQGARPVKRWPEALKKPYGAYCPKELQDYLDLMSSEDHKMTIWLDDLQNKTLGYTDFVTCVADFPNLPIFGAFDILSTYRSDVHISNTSFMPVEDWWKVLTLGTETWRSPVVLTDPIPQPFTHNMARRTYTPPSKLKNIGYVCVRSIFGEMQNRSTGVAFIGRVCFPYDLGLIKFCKYRYWYKVAGQVMDTMSYPQIVPCMFLHPSRLDPTWQTPLFPMFHHEGWILYHNITRRYAFKNTVEEWDTTEINEGVCHERHSDVCNNQFVTFNQSFWTNNRILNRTQNPMWNWTWCYNFSKENCIPEEDHTVLLNATHIHLIRNKTHEAFDSPWQPVLVITPTDIHKGIKWNVSFLQVDYSFNGSALAENGKPYSDLSYKFYDHFMSSLIPVFNISNSTIRDALHNISIPMMAKKRIYNDTKGVPIALERSNCRWFPSNIAIIHGVHRSIEDNVSVYDIPMDAVNTSHITTYWESTVRHTLKPKATALTYKYPKIDEVTLLTKKNVMDDDVESEDGCPSTQLWDTKIRYHVEAADNKTLRWWMTAGMDFSKWKNVIHTGKLPYYWYMLLPALEDDNSWWMYDIVSHDVLRNTTDIYDSYAGNHKIYAYKMTMKDCRVTPESLKPCLIYRGGFNETRGWVTAHYPRSVLFPPKAKMTTTEAPAYLPLLRQPLRFLVHPAIQPVRLRLSLGQAFRDTEVCGSEKWQYVLPDLFYSIARNAAGRRPLQLAAVGAFIAGAALGALIAGAMTEELRVEISALKSLQGKQASVIAGISKNLHSASILIDRINIEQAMLKKQIDILNTVVQTTNEMFESRLKHLEANQECAHIAAMLEASLEDLRVLFQTGIGMETATSFTVLDPTQDSHCDMGDCVIHLWQISTTSAVIGYPTKPVPRKVGDTWLLPYETFYWLTWNDTSFYVSADATYSLGKSTMIAFNLVSDEPLTSDVTISMPQSTLMDLGNYRLLTCHPMDYMVRRWQNITYNETLPLKAGCHIHYNTMMIEHMNATRKQHPFRRINSTDPDYTNRLLSDVIFISNHTFGLHVFVPPPPESQLYEEAKKAVETLNKQFAEHGKIIEAVHNQTTKMIQQFQGETHKVKVLVDSGYLIPRDFKYTYDCSVMGFFRKLVHADFTCIMRWNPFHWFKEILFYVCLFFLLVILVKICLAVNKRTTRKTVVKLDKQMFYRNHEQA
ncbi:uncharacterized protein LOC144377785 [Ictidomys tridecemlineatus]